MRKNKILALGTFALFLLLPPFIHSESHYEYIYSPKSDFYFGHISYTEVKHDGKDPMVIREELEKPEVAVLNFPLVPGDIIRTPEGRRCEIQLDTGTIIRLNFATELKIETIMAKSLSTKKRISNLILNKGEIYIQYKRYNRPEIFQIVTPCAAIKMKHRTVALINAREEGETDIQLRFGQVYVLYGPDEQSLEGRTIKKSGELIISKDHEAIEGKYEIDEDFESWNTNINQNFEELHQGKTFIPAPVQKMSPAIINFAQRYSTLYGEWTWNSLYGYVWRPYFNNYYAAGNWQPFYYGQWRELNDQLFWVPEEAWGWAPYHLGFWFWDEELGWLWRPGSTFAPAWAVWDFYFGNYTWRPWWPMDWMFYDYDYWWNYGYSSNWFYPFYPGYNYYYLIQPGVPNQSLPKAITSVRKDQLKKNNPPGLSLPKELNNVYKRMVTALNKGDARVIAPLKRISQYTVGVKKDDLNAPRIQEKAVRVLSNPLPIQKESPPANAVKNPYQEAVNHFRVSNVRAKALQDVALSVFEGPKVEKRISIERTQPQEMRVRIGNIRGERVTIEKGAVSRRGEENVPYGSRLSRPDSSKAHFRDWNPDSWVARAAGVSIHYVSKSNEIRCPELNLSSINARGSHNMTTMTGIYPDASSGGQGVSYSGGSSSSDSGPGNSSSGSSSAGSHSSGSGSSGGKGKDK